MPESGISKVSQTRTIQDDDSRPSGKTRLSSRGTGIALAFLSAAGFSALGLFAKLIYGAGFSVVQTLAWRFTFASVFLSLVCLYRSKRNIALAGSIFYNRASVTGGLVAPISRFFRIPSSRLAGVALLGLLGFAPQAGMFFLTVRLLDPGMAALLLYLYPSFVLVFSLVFLRKKPSLIQGLALVLSLAGCVLTFFKSGSYPLPGMILAVAVALAYGMYLVAGERVLAGVDAVGSTTLIMLVATLVYWIGVAISGIPPRAPDSLAAVAGFLGVSILSTVLPIVTLFKAMERIGAADTSLVSTIEPVFTLALSAVLFGENPGPAQLVGGLFILAAVVTLRFAKPAR